MDDLLSQVVNQAAQSIADSENSFKERDELTSTEKMLKVQNSQVLQILK